MPRLDAYEASAFLHKLRPSLPSGHIWRGFLDDAQCWWSQHLPGPLFAHAVGRAPFQMLTRSALARTLTGLPQRTVVNLGNEESCAELDRVHSVFKYSDDLRVLDELVAFVGYTAREKIAKDTGRDRILTKIQLLLPISAELGRGQLIVLGAIKHALVVGGLRGYLWSPITVYEYLRQGIKDLAVLLVTERLDAMTGEDFHTEYRKMLEKIKLSQRPKCGAFLTAFHRFLVVAGFDPLPRSLTGRQDPTPPAADTVSEFELELALQYIMDVAPNHRVALQGRLALALAFWIPLRTIELWCVRVGDVRTKVPMFITIYPRARDGVGKNQAMRRQEDVQSIDSSILKSLLIDMVNERRMTDFADDEDYLFGRSGYPDQRYEQLLTTKLMNEALRWASGDERASFYSLRHSAISRRAHNALMEAINGD